MALGTIIAAAVAYENAMTARRGTATYAFDQSILIAQGAEALAAFGVRKMVTQDAKHYVYAGQGWDKPYGPLEIVPGVMLTAYLEDLQGRFNVNWLVDSTGRANPTQVAVFKALLASVGLEEKWAGLLVDWIDMDAVPTIPDGAEDSTYLGQTPPYLTANRYLTSTTELMALPGFDRQHYNLIAPYISALPPQSTRLNLCTASGTVLDAYIGMGHQEFGGSNSDNLTKNRANAGACFPTMPGLPEVLQHRQRQLLERTRACRRHLTRSRLASRPPPRRSGRRRAGRTGGLEAGGPDDQLLPPHQRGHYWQHGNQLVQSSVHGRHQLFAAPDPAQLHAGLTGVSSPHHAAPATHDDRRRTWLKRCCCACRACRKQAATWLVVDAHGAPDRAAAERAADPGRPARGQPARVRAGARHRCAAGRAGDAGEGRAPSLQQLVPYALEEHLADAIDDLHFAIGKRPGDDRAYARGRGGARAAG